MTGFASTFASRKTRVSLVIAEQVGLDVLRGEIDDVDHRHLPELKVLVIRNSISVADFNRANVTGGDLSRDRRAGHARSLRYLSGGEQAGPSGERDLLSFCRCALDVSDDLI